MVEILHLGYTLGLSKTRQAKEIGHKLFMHNILPYKHFKKYIYFYFQKNWPKIKITGKRTKQGTGLKKKVPSNSLGWVDFLARRVVGMCKKNVRGTCLKDVLGFKWFLSPEGTSTGLKEGVDYVLVT